MIRVVVGVVLLYLGFGGVLGGTAAIIADVVGAVLLLTGAIGFMDTYISKPFNQ